jgi:hypothetical protein
VGPIALLGLLILKPTIRPGLRLVTCAVGMMSLLCDEELKARLSRWPVSWRTGDPSTVAGDHRALGGRRLRDVSSCD